MVSADPVVSTSHAVAADDPFLDTDAAAAIPGVHPQTIRKAFRDGRLKGVKVNDARVLRFRRSWVLQWLEGSQVNA